MVAAKCGDEDAVGAVDTATGMGTWAGRISRQKAQQLTQMDSSERGRLFPSRLLLASGEQEGGGGAGQKRDSDLTRVLWRGCESWSLAFNHSSVYLFI